ncbi:glycoside hydrolase family 79 protein [Xylariaceae sp. FL1272]|nr:glycoside hydrolase family 79 protein [Xylariaceae sp. FL1272]
MMAALLSLLALSSPALAKVFANVPSTINTNGPQTLADDFLIGQPLDGFVSFSIEFASFPDFAGNKSHPNKFSNNLLDNLGNLAGTKPYIRVGGNTQDFPIYNPDLEVGLKGTVNETKSPDYPTTIEIGPKFFESYTTFPRTKFSYGFNLGGNNYSADVIRNTLEETTKLACKTLGNNLYLWEYGNEPDLFSTQKFPVRASNYNESDWVAEWLNGTRFIKSVLQEHCPSLLKHGKYGYLAPSFAGVGNRLKAPRAWADGIDDDGDIKYYSTHNYISGANVLGVTLQGTLMNHTSTRASVNAHVTEFNSITNKSSNLVQIMGETNSLYNQGKPGLSNSFGAALWGIDFNLYCAAVGIGRTHMHMGTNYRYASWQPIGTDLESIGTKAPYYGNVAVAAFLGDLRSSSTKVAHIDLTHTNATDGDVNLQAAYAAYVNDSIARIMVVNMREYNYTLNGTGDLTTLNPTPRPSRAYSFALSGLQDGAQVAVKRLYANGSDAITGITWDGTSYNYELRLGKPVKLHNVTTGEFVSVRNGAVGVSVPDSQAVVLEF